MLCDVVWSVFVLRNVSLCLCAFVCEDLASQKAFVSFVSECVMLYGV